MPEEWLVAADGTSIVKTCDLSDEVPEEVRNLVRIFRKYEIESVIYCCGGCFYNLFFDEKYAENLIGILSRVNYCEVVRPLGLALTWLLEPKIGIKENYLVLRALHKDKLLEGSSYNAAMKAFTGILTLSNGGFAEIIQTKKRVE